VEHNKPKRRELERLRATRDAYLRDRHHLLEPFLGDNDYFERKTKKEKKKAATAATATATAAEAISPLDTGAAAGTGSGTGTGEEAEHKNDEEAADGLVSLAQPLPSSSFSTSSSSSSVITSASAGAIGTHGDAANGAVDNAIVALTTVAAFSATPKIDESVIHDSSSSSSSSNVNGDANGHANVKEAVVIETEVVDTVEAEAVEAEALPVELQVSYAMRGVPIVPQPKILKADLHEHQVRRKEGRKREAAVA
jgi:hypothetical protein